MAEMFVSPDRLEERLDGHVVVDVRHSWEYEEGHLPGAVNVPFDEFRDPTDDTPGKLPKASAFAEMLGRVGIESDDHIVVYDADCGVYASRFLVTAEVFGHDTDGLFILDGGYQLWQRERDVIDDEPAVEPTEYGAETELKGPLVDAETLEGALDSDTVVVDTRDPMEYDTVHLPGAVNLQWEWLVDDDTGRLKPTAELRDVLRTHGLVPDRPIRLYCNTARRLSFVYAVLRELDYEDVAFYEGGIDAWAAYGGPVETSG